jgi:hypothetical protein
MKTLIPTEKEIEIEIEIEDQASLDQVGVVKRISGNKRRSLRMESLRLRVNLKES